MRGNCKQNFKNAQSALTFLIFVAIRWRGKYCDAVSKEKDVRVWQLENAKKENISESGSQMPDFFGYVIEGVLKNFSKKVGWDRISVQIDSRRTENPSAPCSDKNYENKFSKSLSKTKFLSK